MMFRVREMDSQTKAFLVLVILILLAVIYWICDAYLDSGRLFSYLSGLLPRDSASSADWAMVLLTLILGRIALGQLNASIENSHREVIVGTIQCVDDRYKAVIDFRDTLRRESQSDLDHADVYHFFHRFWFVQLDQFNYLVIGALPYQLFSVYALVRVYNFGVNEATLSCYSDAQGWNLVRKEFEQFGQFCRFIDRLILVAETRPRSEWKNSTFEEVWNVERKSRKFKGAILRRRRKRYEIEAAQWISKP